MKKHKSFYSSIHLSLHTGGLLQPHKANTEACPIALVHIAWPGNLSETGVQNEDVINPRTALRMNYTFPVKPTVNFKLFVLKGPSASPVSLSV